MIINYAELAVTAVRPGQFPIDGRPEVAFTGKSNVGKSSLINAMAGRKALARASRNPGKTRTINFFDIEHRLYFTDLPGYGYAKVSKSESARWGAMVEGYLANRPPLKLLLLLLDIRHEPNQNDRMLYEWCLYYNLPLAVVATKSDKLKRAQIPRQLSLLRKALNDGADRPENGGPPALPLPFSSETREGRDALWALIMDRCGLSVIE